MESPDGIGARPHSPVTGCQPQWEVEVVWQAQGADRD